MSLLIYFKKYTAIENIKIPYFESRLPEKFDIVALCRGIKNIGLMEGVRYSGLPGELKTFLSIKYNPKKIYDVSLCSSDMLLKILKLKGNVYAPYFSTSFKDICIWDKNVDVDVVKADGSLEHCSTLYEVMEAKCNAREFNFKLNRSSLKPDRKYPFYCTFEPGEIDDFKESFVKKNYKIGQKTYTLNFRVDCQYIRGKLFMLGGRADITHKIFIDAMTHHKFKSMQVCHVNIYAFYEYYGDSIEMELLMGENLLLNFINQDKDDDEVGRLVIIDGIDEVILNMTDCYLRFLNTLVLDEKNTYLLFTRLMSNENFENFENMNVKYADLRLRLKKGDLFLTLTGG